LFVLNGFGRNDTNMLLKTVFIRFYRSFNYDYLRKHHIDAPAKAKPWENVGNAFFPYVRIPIDPHVTTVVGANESGKSHLLSAIEKGISGKGILSQDFCRYSQFFAVTKGDMRTPDFGFEWAGLSTQEKRIIRELCEITAATEFDSFFLFRTSSQNLELFLPGDPEYLRFEVPPAKISILLPRTFRIDADIALPDSVPIRELAREAIGGSAPRMEVLEREQRFAAVEGLNTLLSHQDWFQDLPKFTASAQQLQPALTALAGIFTSPKNDSNDTGRIRDGQIQLARDLICKVAQIDEQALQQLYDALRKGNEGHANGIIEKINKALATRLNFPRVWVQDRDFSLMVSPREHDLVFTIRDRTGTEYSFAERSSGLKYFLSYYIQYLAHETKGPDTEILLMDEPDAYLSSQAQQDLLKVFRSFSEPATTGRHPVQVIYVTHSPFLIDKNNADRIRVLEKGVGDEGTRVVRDVSRNHYEPLRSAFGAFVAETTFIGNCNLMVEGPSDQILLGGATTYLRSRGRHDSETLDLNIITVVPASSASHIPYLVYLARGRDVERPAIIVLLDSDEAGDKAKKQLRRGGPLQKQLIKDDFILQIGQLKSGDVTPKTARSGTLVELEDLIPLSLCVRAVKQYAKEFWNADDKTIALITAESISSKFRDGHSVFDAIESCVESLPGEFHVEKIGFARAVVNSLPIPSREGSFNGVLQTEIVEFEDNMVMLLTKLRAMQRAAEKEQNAVRVSQKVDRLKKGFIQDYPDEASREEAAFILKEIEEVLDDSRESDLARSTVQNLKRDFHLGKDLFQPVPNYPNFKIGLEQIKYAGVIASQEKPNTESIASVLPTASEANSDPSVLVVKPPLG
jgi:hypothetical protein